MILKYICICSSVYSLVFKKIKKNPEKKAISSSQWQFWQFGWQVWPLRRHLQPPDVSPLPCKATTESETGSYMKFRHKISSKCQIRRKWKVKCSYVWTPSSLFSDPADFCPAHDTADPVTAIFLLDDDPTLWAFHGFTILQQPLQREHSHIRPLTF